LPPNLFQRVQPLYTDALFDQPCYDSVFEGKQSARIFVDDADMPTSALMCRSYEYFPAGVVAPALRQFIADAPEEAEVFASFYGYAPLNAGWKDALLALADESAVPLEVIGRCNFQWQPGTPLLDWRARLPAGGRIVPIDRALAERLDREFYPVPFIKYDWGSYEAYEAHGFGFALLMDGAIASSVTATTVSARHALITVATEPDYRRRGLATLVSARFIEHCLERGLLPIWDCDDFNLGSVATARRLSFVERAPFVELALPNRAKPDRTRGLWSPERRADGVTAWRRTSQDMPPQSQAGVRGG
jgi:GNAT superfamily N-acetyltransferase